jgi:hypothetical protein
VPKVTPPKKKKKKKKFLVLNPSLLSAKQTTKTIQTVILQPPSSAAPRTPCYLKVQTQTPLVPGSCSRVFQDSTSHPSRDPSSPSFHNFLLTKQDIAPCLGISSNNQPIWHRPVGGCETQRIRTLQHSTSSARLLRAPRRSIETLPTVDAQNRHRVHF